MPEKKEYTSSDINTSLELPSDLGRRKFLSTTGAFCLAAMGLLTGCLGGGSDSGADNNDGVDNINDPTPPIEVVSENHKARAMMDILEITDTSIKVYVKGDDEDGIIDATLYLLRWNNGDPYLVEEVRLPLLKDGKSKKCSIQYNFEGLYPNRSYILKFVMNSVNGKDGSLEISQLVRNERTEVGNHNPEIKSISGNTTINEGDTLSLTANASDSDGDSLTYTWKIDGSEINGRVLNYSGLSEGTYNVVLTVEDGNGGKTTKTIKVTVNSLTTNTPPEAQDATYDAQWAPSYTVDMRPLISDAESPDTDLQIIADDPVGEDGRVRGTTTVSGTDLTVELNRGESGWVTVEYKVRDPQGLESDTKKIIIDSIDNV